MLASIIADQNIEDVWGDVINYRAKLNMLNINTAPHIPVNSKGKKHNKGK